MLRSILEASSGLVHTLPVSGGARGARLLSRLGALGSDLAMVISRTIGFARELATDPLSSSRLRRASLTAAAAGDELLLACFQQLHAEIDDDAFASKLDEARSLVDHLDGLGVLARPESWHVPCAPAQLTERERRIGHLSFTHATYQSRYSPADTVPGATRYAEHTRNETVHAWLLRQRGPAPWVVCVHGAGMGDPLADLVVFRATALHAAGFNVAIPVLPHHGPRGSGRFTVAFPNEDPAMNLHGASQAISDVRALLAYIAERGERAVLFGLSLGGYVAAAVAALEDELAGVVVGVPVVDIADLMRTHTPPRFARHPRRDDFFDIAVRLDPVTSPVGLSSPSVLVRRIWAGRADRLVRPGQVQRLAEHWSAPTVSWYQGGHLGFFAAPTARRCVSDALVDAGVARRHEGRLIAV
jgi:pimeloyl-ACP methyl ester carboxylesterase